MISGDSDRDSGAFGLKLKPYLVKAGEFPRLRRGRQTYSGFCLANGPFVV